MRQVYTRGKTAQHFIGHWYTIKRMSIELTPIHAQGAKPRKKPSQRYSLEERQALIVEVRELMQRGTISCQKIADNLNIDVHTAWDYRKAAMALIAKDDQGWNRDATRNMQIGRINHLLEGLYAELPLVQDPIERGKLHDRIIKYFDSLHRITGLNTDVVQMEHTVKPLQIVRAQEVIESTVIPNNTDLDNTTSTK